MHTYSINSDERKTVIGILGILSIAIMLIVKNNLCLPSWVPIPSVFAIFGGFYWIFDQLIWKLPLINQCLSTPNLNGTWTILMKSSRDSYATEYEGVLTITQSWSKIYIFMDGEKAIGQSIMAGIEVHTSKSFTLKWEYLSQRKPEFAENEYMHYGMTRVMNQPNGAITVLKGDYYADRSRHSSGPVSIIKKA
ncbi:hypothetical protein HB364_17130 [Pseudoflavitalea sp. X16]|uniref:Cap15 family cyclic dinucleotide receptor domain-containing protein n=1 Tax=Paraflavitalea devenefica TaxID=2716334 RepID=UPI001423D74F|nr:hypothetical protein [Paraflavitalea devenefica]NII26816.1 hypothetical protein [Paraflavitalea devenefica]